MGPMAASSFTASSRALGIALISGGDKRLTTKGTRAKDTSPGTMAAAAQFVHVISTPTALAAKPTHKGFPAMEVRNIMQVVASVW